MGKFIFRFVAVLVLIIGLFAAGYIAGWSAHETTDPAPTSTASEPSKSPSETAQSTKAYDPTDDNPAYQTDPEMIQASKDAQEGR